MKVEELETPCLVLDLDQLEKNITCVHQHASSKGKKVRPHAKTHKCSEIARLQVTNGATGICVAKLSEAEGLIKSNFDNILITGPVVGRNKIENLAALVAKSPSLMVVLDHAEIAAALNYQLAQHQLTMNVLLDIDVGLHRTGVKPADGPALAAYIQSLSNLHLSGIQAYAGHLQHLPSFQERYDASRISLQPAQDLFKELRKTIKTCSIFSGAGTGTWNIDTELAELTELQVGSYVLMDAEYLNIGSAPGETRFTSLAPALKLMTTVISTNQEKFVTVDAGLKTLYQHGGIPEVVGPAGYDLEYDWFGDEYGCLTPRKNTLLPPINTVAELFVSHCDPTVNLFDVFYVVRDDEVIDTWSIDLRGCSK